MKCGLSWGHTSVPTTVAFPMCHTIGKTTGPLKQFNDLVLIPRKTAAKPHIQPPNNFGRDILLV